MNPNFIRFLESIVYGDRKDFLAVVIKSVLSVLSGLYGVILWVYLMPFMIGIRKKQRLEKPVISVGNLTTGGTGKTPTTQYLCRGLINRGWSPAVLSYGYSGSLHGKLGVVSDKTGVLLTPDIAGDEPVMLASGMPGVPVLVCKHRTVSGRKAIWDAGADILVLDDGFQVWKLHRDMDIVLVNGGKPFDNGRMLPAGRLREPVAALRRADCVISIGDCEPAMEIRRIAPEIPVCFGRFKASALNLLADGSGLEMKAVQGMKILAMSSIANPGSFEETLAEIGVKIVCVKHFPDHYLYSAGDIDIINQDAAECGAEYIITTDKDAVKLTGFKFSIPIAALRIKLELDDEPGFWELITRKVGKSPNTKQN